MAKAKVFIDSSVIITALLSTQGGGFYILTELKDRFEFLISEYSLREIINILRSKFSGKPELISNLFLLLGNAQIITLQNPSKRDVLKLSRYISINDAPILASALHYSDYLLTLDNEFFKPEIVNLASQQSLIIIKPKGFIELFRN